MKKQLLYPLLLSTSILITGCSIGTEIPITSNPKEPTTQETSLDDKKEELKEEKDSDEEITADFLINRAFKGKSIADSLSYELIQEADVVLSNGAEMNLNYLYNVDENKDYFHQYGTGYMKVGSSYDEDDFDFYGDASSDMIYMDNQWSRSSYPLKDSMITKEFSYKFVNTSDVNFDGENYSFSADYVTSNCKVDLVFDKNYNLIEMDIQDGDAYLKNVLNNLSITDVSISDITNYKHSIIIDLNSINNTPEIVLPDENNIETKTDELDIDDDNNNNNNIYEKSSANMNETFAEFYFGTNNITAEQIMNTFEIDDASLAYNVLDTFTNYTKEELIEYVNENYKYMTNEDFEGICLCIAFDFITENDFVLFSEDAFNEIYNSMMKIIEEMNLDIDVSE